MHNAKKCDKIKQLKNKGMSNIYTFHITTLGCRVNQYESRAIAEGLVARGLIESQSPNNCDLYIINTCTVTAESSRKSRQMIRRAASHKKDAVVIVAGCYSEISTYEVASLECADLIIGTGDKTSVCDKAIDLLSKREEKNKTEISISAKDKYDQYTISTPEKARTYLKIEDGCNGKCAYCIIPKARGPVRSKQPEIAVDEAKKLAAGGAKEIVLTGIEISGYQYDLIDLIKNISEIPEIERIRLGSLEPSMLKEELVRALASIDKLMPHFHLSIQSGCSRTLAAMRRKYNAQMAFEAIERIRRYFPSVMLTADLIVGFPGETEADFLETLEFLRKSQFLHVHIFPYSIRPDTEAASMKEQLSKPEKDARLRRASTLQDEIVSNILSVIVEKGDPIPVLIESENDGVLSGHSDNFIEVEAIGDSSYVSQIVNVLPIRAEKGVLKAKII